MDPRPEDHPDRLAEELAYREYLKDQEHHRRGQIYLVVYLTVLVIGATWVLFIWLS